MQYLVNYTSKILHCTVVQAAKGEIGRKRSTEWLLMEHLHLSSPLIMLIMMIMHSSKKHFWPKKLAQKRVIYDISEFATKQHKCLWN